MTGVQCMTNSAPSSENNVPHESKYGGNKVIDYVLGVLGSAVEIFFTHCSHPMETISSFEIVSTRQHLHVGSFHL